MDLINAIKNYQQHQLPALIADKNYYETLTLKEAIQKAAEGKNSKGKTHSHQYRVGAEIGGLGASNLLLQIELISQCKTFEELFAITEDVKKDIYRLGDLWSYDTALRIGFNLKLYPKNVHVQRGVVKGVKKLFKDQSKMKFPIELKYFSPEFQELQPYEIENFLCIWGKDGTSAGC